MSCEMKVNQQRYASVEVLLTAMLVLNTSRLLSFLAETLVQCIPTESTEKVPNRKFCRKCPISVKFRDSKKVPPVITALVQKNENRRLIGGGVPALVELSKTQAFLGRHVLGLKIENQFQ
jgi:hypothetical protein